MFCGILIEMSDCPESTNVQTIVTGASRPPSPKRSEAVTALVETLCSPSDSYTRASAAEALGTVGDPQAVPALIAALSDSNYLCVCAAGALAQIKHPDAIPHLVAVLEDRNRFWVPRGAAAVALGQFTEAARSALPALQRALTYDCEEGGENWDPRAREAVDDAIGHITDPSAPCRLKGRGCRFEMWGIY
jgi:HEAT repeat protein